ncbi:MULTISPECIES: hypothetical protein [Aeromicrobium]|uniref:hypothetical protein n=1 Tax=Aeromicrobium TaxID=2040 RepID=UPI0006F84A3A|nr:MULTISPECIES: hypothetical protein [Aeromicrobium]KQX75345.1 hypothetical protein ASD10_09260 [Aeromicrobium sp. Root472D3]MCL8250137.1 hypothetical protein [Aeromicrobium fastidiosum]
MSAHPHPDEPATSPALWLYKVDTPSGADVLTDAAASAGLTATSFEHSGSTFAAFTCFDHVDERVLHSCLAEHGPTATFILTSDETDDDPRGWL